MSIRERYARRAAYLLKRHKITRIDENLLRYSSAHRDRREVRTPEPVNAMTFFVLAHEIAHIVLPGHQYMDRAGLTEIEADAWAVEELKKARGWVPCTIQRLVTKRAADNLAHAVRRGWLEPMSIVEGLRLKTGGLV